MSNSLNVDIDLSMADMGTACYPAAMRELIARLKLLLRARYPLIQLVSHEEARVLRALQRLGDADKLPVWTWSAVSGLGLVGKTSVKGTESLEVALDRIGNDSASGLFVLLDAHPHLDDPRVVRRLRDLGERVGSRRQALILVGSVAGVPEELEKLAITLDVPLPDRDEVGRLLTVLLKAQRIDIPGARFDRFVKGALGLTENEIKRLFARIVIGGGGFQEADLAALVEEKRQAIRRSPHLEFWDTGGSITEVGGMDALKRWLEQRALAFTPQAHAYGLPEPRGLFMLGVQGCGKSLMAKAVADLWQLPLLRLDVAALFQKAGRREDGLRETVRIAESLSPAVLWIDEIEKGFTATGGAAGEAFGYFLTWMQEKTKPVFVVSTANEVKALPPELLRKGRFDEIFFVDLPNVHERLQILEIHLSRRSRDPEEFDLTVVAEETDRFSGAELEQVVVAALFQAFADNREVDSEDVLDVAREMIPLAVTMDERLKQLREWARPRARRASTDRRRVDFFEEWDEAG